MTAPKAAHYQLGQRVGDVANWAEAVFLTCELPYAAHVEYAERLNARGCSWSPVIEVDARDGHFTKTEAKVLTKAGAAQPDGEFAPGTEEYDPSIVRATDPKALEVVSVLFVNVDYLEQQASDAAMTSPFVREQMEAVFRSAP